MLKLMSYNVPYDFVLKELYPLRPEIKKMLGGYALHLDKKLIIFLRERETQLEFNGVFIATTSEHFKELQAEIHTSRMEFDFDGTRDSWIFLSEDLSDFEEKVKKACEMIRNSDNRIGR
jgi:hypothetical protein